jgi:hypothetical protein
LALASRMSSGIVLAGNAGFTATSSGWRATREIGV